MLRPVPARWFQTLVAQDDAAPALEALARTGAIELEVKPAAAAMVPVTELKGPLDAYNELAQQYHRYWPVPVPGGPAAPAAPRDTLTHALRLLEHWRQTAEPIVRQLQELELEVRELETWRELFMRFKWSPIDFGLLARPSRELMHRLYVLPPDVAFPLPSTLLAQTFELQHQTCLLVIGPADTMARLHRQVTAMKGHSLAIPVWMEGRAADNLPRLGRRLSRARRGIARLQATLDRLSANCALAETLSEVERLRWFAEQVRALPASDYFAWITGWTSDTTGGRLRNALARARVRALVQFPEPPPGSNPPLILRNPAWARPFEIFARALGVPGRHEVDPSRLLALITPLLFGYMFGDVGQGLVLLLVGLWLQRRLPVMRLLVAGGSSAIVFGWLFGSVFSREDLVPALWLHPLQEPLLVLGLPLLGGATILTLGLVLNALEEFWRGRLAHWALTDAGLLVFYVAAGASLAMPLTVWLAAAGLVWYIGGHAWIDRRVTSGLVAIGTMMEHVFQLAVNTLSFARVGAFALAHAGLSSAVVILADVAGHPVAGFVIMLVGNLVIIALEGLVVSIQTTRLVLFEFFIRFLRGQGRAFRPLVAPSSPLQRRIA